MTDTYNAANGTKATQQGDTGDPTALRVVLVDDSYHTRERAAEMLSAVDGVKVIGQAADVPSGLAILRESKPDLLILDIEMPGESGLQLLEAARLQSKSLLIMMLTGFDHPKLREHCAELGASYYFSKTTEFEKIVEVCEELAAARAQRLPAGGTSVSRPFVTNANAPIERTGDGKSNEELNILILEDNEADLELMLREMRRTGLAFKAKRVESEAEFLRALRIDKPDLVLADHSLPKYSGETALAAVQKETPDTPFIFVCGNTDEDTAIEALKHGAVDYVRKERLQRLGPAIRRALRDVADREHRRRAATALREMEERYQALFDSSLDCLYVMDFEGRFIDANPTALQLVGYCREEISSLTIHTLLEEQEIPKAYENIQEVLTTGKQKETCVFRMKRKDGGRIVIESTASLILHEGKPYAVLGIARDVTDRDRAEAEIRRVNRLYTVLSQVNLTLMRASTRDELLQQVCRIAVEEGGFKAVWIGFTNPESNEVVPVAHTGEPAEFFTKLKIFADNRPEGQGPSGTAFRAGKPAMFNDFRADPRTAHWHEYARQAGVNAVASFPIRLAGVVCGVFSLYHTEKNVFQEKEVALLCEVAENISSGMERLEQTSKKQLAEESLRESELRYRMILKETGQVVYDYALPTGRIQWDGAVEEVLGCTLDEIQRMTVQDWEEHIHPEDRPQVLAMLDKAITRRHRYHVEYRFRSCGGRFIHLEEHGSFHLDAQGNASRMVGTLNDITERKNAEERIREQARLLDLAHDAILVRGLDDNIVYWNESAERLYGWSADEAVGRNVAELLRQDAAHSAEISKSLFERDEWNGELTHTTKSGQSVLVESRLTLVRDRQGRPKSILSINADITERKKLEAQFLRAQRMESIGTLASGVAHDLNNVLAPIMMGCQLLGESSTERDRRQLLDLISTSVQRGADLVRQVLAFCRGVEGRRIELRVQSVVKEVDHILRETFPKSIRVETRLHPDLWSVVADPTQLHQVLLNLCVNSRDAMANGGTLSVKAENVTLDGQYAGMAGEPTCRPYVVLTVADTGVGIPAELREKVFDPFFTTKEVGKGTGLGLSTSLAIVKSHGGFMNLYSEPGKGTAFKVYLPALTNSNAAILQAREAQLPRGNGELILLVDDESAIRTVTKQTLLSFGYNVITASDGAEALQTYLHQGKDVAVVLTDMMMPGMDGPTAIQAMRRLNPKLKVIATSGLSSESHMSKATADSMTAFLSKPYTAETLLKTMAKVLSETPAASKIGESQQQ